MNNELVSQPSWWKRNWKWVVPVGGCFGIILLFVFFIGSLFYGVATLLEGTDPYEYAIEKINNDQQLIDELGTPIVKEGMVQGSINYTNGNGEAIMQIPISGPKGKGILYINASSINDNWTYHEIRVEINDEESFKLLGDDPLNEF